jgi:hypothetical protein
MNPPRPITSIAALIMHHMDLDDQRMLEFVIEISENYHRG